MMLVGLFLVLSGGAYFFISLFGQLTSSDSGSLSQSVLAAFKPLPLLVILLGNALFAAALFVGFKISPYALPMAIAVGVIASFVYSAVFLGGTVTWMKVLGVAFILLGVYFVK